MGLAVKSVVGACEAECSQRAKGPALIDQPAGPVPIDAVVEIAGHHGRALGEEIAVVAEREAQRTRLTLAPYAVAEILGPDGEKIDSRRSIDPDGSDMFQASPVPRCQRHPMAVE